MTAANNDGNSYVFDLTEQALFLMAVLHSKIEQNQVVGLFIKTFKLMPENAPKKAITTIIISKEEPSEKISKVQNILADFLGFPSFAQIQAETYNGYVREIESACASWGAIKKLPDYEE